jgi:hypothetical protein
VQDTMIRNFQGGSGLGIQFVPTVVATMNVLDTVIEHNGNSGVGGGIQVAPANGSATAVAVLERVTVTRNVVGVAAIGQGGASAMQINNTVISNNSSIGLVSTGTGGVIRIGRSEIINNAGGSINGNVLSYLDNQVNGNSPDTFPASAGGYH